jgi:hypothetical protein
MCHSPPDDPENEGRRAAMSQKIVFNGTEYASPDAMPDDVRQQYEHILGLLGDPDGNGVPDLFERPAGGTHIDARVYSDPAQVPPAHRDLVERARALGGHHINVDRTFRVTYLGDKDGHRLLASPGVRAFIEKAVFIGLVVLLVAFIVIGMT